MFNNKYTPSTNLTVIVGKVRKLELDKLNPDSESKCLCLSFHNTVCSRLRHPTSSCIVHDT